MSSRTGILLLLLVTACVFCPLLVSEFLWDDQILVLENLLTHDPSNLPLFFSSSLWEATPISEPSSPYYRPMMQIELLLDRQIFGLSAMGHHAHSLAWHLACTLLVWRFLRGLGGEGISVLAATGVFALHPFQTEIVAFTAARNDAMALAGIVGALILLEERCPSRLRLAQASACALYALLSKETALVLPLVLALCDYSRHGKIVGATRYGAIGAAMAGFALLRLLAPMGASELQVTELLRSAPEVTASYASRILWPVGTSPTTHFGVLPISFPLVALAVILAGLALRTGGRMAACGLGLFLAGLAPALVGVMLYGGLPYRYAYLPMLGIAVAYCSSWRTRPNHLTALVIPLMLVGLTSSQLTDWATDQSFWERGYRVAPSVDTACGLFKAYEAKLNKTPQNDPDRPSQLARTESILQEALSFPPSQYCCYSAARWYWSQGVADKARISGLRALENGCKNSPELLAPLAMSEAITGHWDAAESHAILAGRDPTGLAPVVLSAAALRRGDESVLSHWEQKQSTEAQLNLREQVEFVLKNSASTPTSSSVSPTDESESQ